MHWLGPRGAGNLAPTWFPFRMVRLRPNRLQLLRVLRNRTPPDSITLLLFRQMVERPGLPKRHFCAFDWPKRRSACPGLSSIWRNDHERCGLGQSASNKLSSIWHVGSEPHLSTRTRTPPWAWARLFREWAHQTRAAETHGAAHDSNEPSITLSGSPHRGAGPIGHSGWSPTGGRARGHMSRLNVQRAETGPPSNLADGPVRGGQRPADLLVRAILGRWQVHCEIIANRSIS